MFVADKYINSSGLQTIKNWVEDKIPTSTSDLTNDSGFTTETYVNTAVSNKQDVLTFDNTPTENSNNPVTSGGVYTALAGKQDTTFYKIPYGNDATGNPTLQQILTDYFVNGKIPILNFSMAFLGTIFYCVSCMPVYDPDAMDLKAYGFEWSMVGKGVSGTAISFTRFTLTNDTLKEAYSGDYDASQDTWSGLDATDMATNADLSGKLSLSGGTMTGALVLSGAPTADLNPATKKYVDDICGDVETALSTINTTLGGMV